MPGSLQDVRSVLCERSLYRDSSHNLVIHNVWYLPAKRYIELIERKTAGTPPHFSADLDRAHAEFR